MGVNPGDGVQDTHPPLGLAIARLFGLVIYTQGYLLLKLAVEILKQLGLIGFDSNQVVIATINDLL